MDANGRSSKYMEGLIEKRLNDSPEIIREYGNYLYNMSVTSKYRYLNIAYNFLKYANCDVNKLTYDIFYNYIINTKNETKEAEKERTTQSIQFLQLKKFCEFLYKKKIISKNYMDEIPRPKAVESRSTIERRNNGYLTVDEMKIVMNNINADDSALGVLDRAIFAVFLNTGIRESAFIDLNLSDYDRVKRCLTVTEKEDTVREYCISENVCKLIDKWLKMREQCVSVYTNQLFIHLVLEDIDPDMIICGPYLIYNKHAYTYREMTKGDLYRTIINRTSCIEGKHITPHKLRATYGTQIYEKTKDIYFTQKCMGHKSPQTTERYIRSNVNPTIEASDIMTNLLT